MSRLIKCDACGYTRERPAQKRMYTLYPIPGDDDRECYGLSPTEQADICEDCLPLGVVELLDERYRQAEEVQLAYEAEAAAKAAKR